MIRLWTDGCCLKNPGGAGGWAFVAEESGRVLHQGSGAEGSGADLDTRMELMAVIEGLRWALALSPGTTGRIIVRPDSRYVVDGATVWRHNWKQNGWKKKPGSVGEIKNVSLWQDLDALLDERAVDFRWVKGHSGAQFNEMADRLAELAATSALTWEPV